MASANNLGTAYIKIAPQMQGIQKSISDGLAGIKSTSLPGATALGTVIAKGVSAAMNLVTSSLDDAIKRTDVINNFPKVMSNIGIGADEAQESIDTLKKKLDGLPTSLQAGAMAVQRFTSKNSDIKKSTDLFLALNNAILAGGAPAEIQATAIEQMSQAYAKGKPDMMEWRAIQSAMPAQLRQIAIAMGYGADGVAELGEALRHNEVSMDDFMATIVRLNQEGANGFQSFEQQAKNSTDGIGTALTNVKNRAAAAIQQVIQSFGAKDVSEAINKFSASFNGIASWISENIVPIVKNQLVPVLKGVLSVAKGIVEFIAQNKWVQNFLIGLLDTLIAFKAVSLVKGAVTGIISPIASLAKGVAGSVSTFTTAAAGASTLGSSIGGLATSATTATAATGGLVGKLGAIAGTLGAAGTASVVGLAATAFLSLGAAAAGSARDANIAAKAAKDYARAHYDAKQAVESHKKAVEMQSTVTKELTTATDEQTAAERRAVDAAKVAEEAMDNLKQLKRDGKEGTLEYKEAEIQLRQAIQASKEAADDYRTTQKKVNDLKKESEGLATSDIYKQNLVIGSIMKESKEYGNLAAQLDMLRGQTMQYKDANGEMVTATLEQTDEMVQGLAEQLAIGNETWRAIVDKANEEGISFSEACSRYGLEAGENITGNFKQSVNNNLGMVTEASHGIAVIIRETTSSEVSDAGDDAGKLLPEHMANGIRRWIGLSENAAKDAAGKAVSAASSKASDAYSVGENITKGFGNGSVSNAALTYAQTKMVNAVSSMVNKAKKWLGIQSPSKVTAELGMYMSLGFAKGIDDYADAAVEAAEDMADRTAEAMNKTSSFDGLIQSQVQPQTSLTGDAEGAGNKVIQNNTFEVNSELDVKEISKRLGWQVATAL